MRFDASALPAHKPAQLAQAIQFDIESRIAGRTYRIFVQQPSLEAPDDGYPLIVTLDGNLSFPIAAALSRTFVPPLGVGRSALVVGVGYPTEEPLELGALRLRDLTPQTPLEAIPQIPGGPPPTAEAFGGADAFLGFITDELRPRLASAWPLNATDTTLYGHSLAGLFTLHALFSRPNAFRTYAANSPSIWWNGRDILEREAAFVRTVEAVEASPRVLITVGAAEQQPPTQAPPGVPLEVLQAQVAGARMVDNAAELGARLAAVEGGPGYLAHYRVFAEDDHTTALTTSIGAMLSFALKD